MLENSLLNVGNQGQDVGAGGASGIDDKSGVLLRHLGATYAEALPVTPDAAKAVTEAKAGKIEYRLDKTNIIHCPVGKVSFGVEKLQENFDTLMGAIIKAKPAASKGQYIRSCTVATTMGPGVKINPARFVVTAAPEK